MKKIIFCILSFFMLCACSYQQNAQVSVSSNCIPYLFLNEDLYTEYDAKTVIPIQLNNENVIIDKPGTYLISGELENGHIAISAPSDTTVRLVLDNISLTSSDNPAIEVINMSKVQISTLSNSMNTITSDNHAITTNGTLVFNGSGTLSITSNQNAIQANHEVIITGGNYQITSQENGIYTLDTIAIQNGVFDINAGKDALHCGSESTSGFIYLQDGTYGIASQQDGLHCEGTITIENAKMNIEAQKQSIYSQSNLQ